MSKKSFNMLKKIGITCIPKGWEDSNLKKVLLKTKLGGNYNSSEGMNGLPLIKMGNLDRGNFKLDKIEFISKENQYYADDLLREGDLLFNTRNTLDLVGKVAVWREELPKALYNSNLLKMTFNSKFISSTYFMNYVFNSHYVIKQLRTVAIGTTSVAAIYDRDLKNVHIFFPSLLTEQKKIVQILSSWDKAVKTTEKLIEQKKLLQKGLMQKLLTGKIRFKKLKNAKWGKIQLKQFLKLTLRPLDKPKQQYNALGIRSHGKGLFDRIIEDPETVMMDTLYQVKKNDLIVNITFAWEGAIAIVQEEKGLVSHRFPTFVFNTRVVIPEYFKHVIVTKRFIHNLGLVSPGGAGRNRVLNKKDFLKLQVPVPLDIKEQKKIADLLCGLDTEINYLEDYLKAIKQQKKSLMQKLLTGQIRVKV